LTFSCKIYHIKRFWYLNLIKTCSILGQGLGSRGGVAPPSAERILGHMERIRSRGTCPVLFRAEGMQKALQIAQAACTDTQRMLFSNLFQLLEDDEPHTPTTNKNSTGGKGRGRKAAPTFGNSNKRTTVMLKSVIKELSDSSEESSEVSTANVYRVKCFI
jgi:hypothetical protein